MNSIKRGTVLAALAAVLSLLVPNAGLAAADQSSVQDQVAAALRANPGSHQVNETTIELEPGVRLSVRPDVEPAGALYGCNDIWICLYQHSNYGGERLSFYRCQDIKLQNYHLSSGPDWRDQASSFVNNQTPGRLSHLKDTKPDGSFYVYYSVATQTVANLVNVPHPGSGNWNDKIDRLQVC
jgi:hypothetical protein